MELENLKKSRAATKGAITRIETWFLTNKDICCDSVDFEIRLDRVNSLFIEYERIQGEIEILSDSENPDTEDRGLVEDKYFSVVSGLTKCIKNVNKTVGSPPSSSASSQHGSQISHYNSPNMAVKLPDIKIQVFTGDVKDFESFFQLFDALIVKNEQLSDIQKLIYLKSYLKGEPLQLIDSLKIVNKNFQVALGILKSRYENKIVIVNSYLSDMLDIPSISKGKSCALRELVTTLQKNIQSLKNLGLSYEELWNVLMIYLVQKKLDFNTKKAFEAEKDHSEIPSLDFFLRFIEKRCLILESIEVGSPKIQRKFVSVNHSTNSRNISDKNSQGQSCLFCKKSGHRIYTCFTFKNSSFQDKTKFVKTNKLCNNCLGRHNIEHCSSKLKCSICSQLHNTLLHNNQSPYENSSSRFNASHSRNTNPDSTQCCSKPNNTLVNSTQTNDGSQNPGESVKENSIINTSSHSLSIKNSHILLATAKVGLMSRHGELVQVKALLDTGTQTSLISQKLVNKLNCNTYYVPLCISGISGSATSSSEMTDIEIFSNCNQNKKFRISCALLPNLTCQLPQCKILVNRLIIPQDIILADNEFFEPSDVDLILGLDCYYDIILPNIIKLGHNLPVLQDSHLGWIISGVIPKKFTSSFFSSYKSDEEDNLADSTPQLSFLSTSKVEKFLKKFWELEDIGDVSRPLILSQEEQLAEDIFVSSTKILHGGRYQVNLPLKSPSEFSKLGDSFFMARKRFFTLENRFKANENLFQDYKKFIDEYIDLDHAHYVPLTQKTNLSDYKYFIPHLCVIRENSATTKLRVVFDASAKSSSGYSLNDICLKGYQVQPDLYDILCRFRSFPFVFTTDIKKMYRQILINPEFGFLHNVLWREQPSDDLKCIQLDTVTYGTNCAPFLATRVLKDIATRNINEFPLASESLLNQFYMDDGLCGALDSESLLKLYKEINTLLQKHGFELHKLFSSSDIFLKSFPENPSNQTSTEYEINFGNVPNKVLGKKWNPASDTLCISVPENIFLTHITKRKILSIIAQCYDPLGLINPVIVKGKILIQRLWILKLDWDTEITDISILQDWKSFLVNLPLLSQQTIPRYYFLHRPIQRIELHGFADASLAAFGCCVYFRAVYQDGSISCSLISSKSRISPVKTVSLPRLELCAMLLLSKLVTKLVNIFKSKLIFSSVNLWTDSQIALAWCKSHASRWSVFVSNRVSQIQDLTLNYKWRHIKSSDNVADLLSRGVYAQDIVNNQFWWHGPDFLHHPFNIYDYDESLETNLEIPEERKSHICTNITKVDFWDEIFKKFSNFRRLQRTISFIFRFITNLKTNKGNRHLGSLTIRELDNALKFIILKIQHKCFSKEILELKSEKTLSNKQLIPFKPFLDDSGLLRVGGRLENASIPFNQKHPIILPSKNYITFLILNLEHRRLGHAGAQNTLANIRLRFWPLNGLRDTKKVIRDCTVCFRFSNEVSQQIMANLPEDRVTISRPFNKVGVDFGGPFFIKSSRLRKAPMIKSYIAIFVCMVTKAVHIEVVSSLSTENFILALKRFVSRRGNPSIIYSDNATNFVGARHELKELYEFFRNKTSSKSIQEFLSQNETTWKFIPPRSPHWGGLWESAIKSAKYHMRRIIGNSNLTFEEFSTVLCQIEAVLNSRPLGPLSNDPSDLNCLTPGHFLVGSALSSYPEKDLCHISENRLSVYQKISQMRQCFWKRWSVEYLNRLQNRPKWFREKANLKVNDLVLVREDDVPPLRWPLGRILEAIEGRDGKVRVVKIRTSHGTYIRPITKLSLLPNQVYNCDDQIDA